MKTRASLFLGVSICFLEVAAPAQTNYDFDLPLSFPCYTLAVQQDGRILVGNVLRPLRLLPNGDADPSFVVSAPGLSSFYTLAATVPDGFVVGGSFSQVNGQARTNLARFLSSGALDSTFTSGPNHWADTVFALAVQTDGKLLVGGGLSNLNGHSLTNLGRLNPDGTVDTAFVAAIGGPVYSIVVQPDGRILVAGDGAPGEPRGALARLNANGSLDLSFQPAGVLFVETMVLQPDGRIVVGGHFTSPAGASTNGIRRYDSNGTLDQSFAAAADGPVYSIALQADGKMLVGGGFTNLDGDLRPGFGRLNPDGSRDTNFNPLPYAKVFSLGLQSDGKILIGAYLRPPGSSAPSIARLLNTDQATETLACDGLTITWLRGGTAPEITGAEFLASVDGTDWTSIGHGSRIAGGWQLTGLTLPANSLVRARGWVAVGQYNGPSWFVESASKVSLLRPLVLKGTLGFQSRQFGFHYSANPGSAVTVEASSDLLHWTPLSTNIFGSAPLSFSDSSSTNLHSRCYRLRQAL